jgi:pyrroloquinoline quinone biosynthesis protein D
MPEPDRPRLAPGVRLHFDQTRNAWVLLGPERVIETEGPASEILRRCDGTRTVGQIVDELAALYTAERAEIEGDVQDMLTDTSLSPRLPLLLESAGAGTASRRTGCSDLGACFSRGGGAGRVAGAFVRG